jgi:hypothetical protein
MATPSPEHQPSPAPTTQAQRLRMSYEEFLAWADVEAIEASGGTSQTDRPASLS